jgi:hypothetical protein
MANRNFMSQKMFTGHAYPVLIDCNFIVDSTNGNGLGIRSLKGPYVSNVFMHTTQTPATGSPNPAAGVILIQLTDNFNRSLTGFRSVISPVSGTPVKIDNAALTPGVAYTITTLGDASTATWQGVGLPTGVTPAAGVSFIATSAGGSGNTSSSRVETSVASGLVQAELVGDPNLSIAPNPGANQGYGASFIVQCYNGSGTITAPADGTVISLAFLLNNSSVSLQGE